MPSSQRAWVHWAIEQVTTEEHRSADTHLLKLRLPRLIEHGIDFYLKDESTHPTRSLKHRLARSLFLYALSGGKIVEGTTVVEASSGSTAISEAYFASLLGLPFVAVVPRETAPRKIAEIEAWGATCHKVASEDMSTEAARLAAECGGYFMDQFTFAERATDWRGNNNIAESIFQQLHHERCPQPRYIVVPAGTGGTSATIGRYLRYHPDCGEETRLVVPDPENSAFFDAYKSGDFTRRSDFASKIEGIGRQRVEKSFLPEVVDEMVRVPDSASLGAMLFLRDWLNRPVGASTGTNLYASLLLAERMIESGEEGAIVSLICDAGERYTDTYYAEAWRNAHNLDAEPTRRNVEAWVNATGKKNAPYLAEKAEFAIRISK